MTGTAIHSPVITLRPVVRPGSLFLLGFVLGVMLGAPAWMFSRVGLVALSHLPQHPPTPVMASR